ncbi:MAG: DMT family transporter [Candidatus Thorarchaeota archaeon]
MNSELARAPKNLSELARAPKNLDSETAPKRHYRAVGEALLVTVLWASSWVIIKFGLEGEGLPPITFAGLRYSIAAGILLVIILSNPVHRTLLRDQNRQWWRTIVLYGLDLMDAIPVSMLLNLTPIVVLGLGVIMLKEIPTRAQTVLVFLVVIGAMIYFYPIDLDLSETVGLIVVLIGVIANAFSSIMGRSINRERNTPPIVVTGVSMAIGAVILLIIGVVLEGLTVVTPIALFYIIWLSIVNTAFAFTLWNKAMQTLRAVDITVINSTMLPQIVILSIVFLGEVLDPLDWIGLIILALSVALIQILQARRVANNNKLE